VGEIMDIRARDIMTREVLVVKAEDKVEKAARILLENKISGIPVVDEEDRVIGIISEKDLIIKAGKK
jgi:CBS domain-containing protein